MSAKSVDKISNVPNMLYKFLLNLFFDTFGISTKSNLLEIQIPMIPSINEELVKFKKYLICIM